MRLPTLAPVRLRIAPRTVPLALGLALTAVVPIAATASHYVVDAGGAGDFTTIQAALDQRAVVFRDTVLVMPGSYDEALAVPATTPQPYIVGAAGASVTSTRSVSFNAPGYGGYVRCRVEGLTFTHSITVGNTRLCWFSHCSFFGPVSATSSEDVPNFGDCDFHAPVNFYGYIAYLQPEYHKLPFSQLRFHGAPLTVGNGGAGPTSFQFCSFEGPADTLVYGVGGEDPVYFDNCAFAGAGTGIVFAVGGYGQEHVTRCTFEDLVVDGIRLQTSPAQKQYRGIEVADSRFERCGTAVRWVARGMYASGPVQLLRDTVLASTGDGVVLGRESGGDIHETLVDGSEGHGVAFLQNFTYNDNPTDAKVTNSVFTHNGGDGVHVECNTDSPSWLELVGVYFPPNVAFASTFAANGGAGLRITAPSWDVRDCTAFDNGGDGFACATTLSRRSSQLVSNTSALNEGDGFRISGPAASADSLQFVRNNLSSMNTGAGFRLSTSPSGSLAFNDAWQNYLGEYVGVPWPADSNLTVDPRFCDLSAGLAGLGLQQGSPCGPSGVYGLIGARPEECPNVTAVPPPTAGPLAFAVRPSVARGSVEFAAPAGGEGRVAVYDLAGRVLWRSPLGGAHASVRWNGEGTNGRMSAGLYWVRFTRGTESTTQRLVWLE